MIRNLKVTAAFVNGDVRELPFKSGKEFIDAVLGDVVGVLPRYMTLLATDQNGEQVNVTIPYDDSDILRVI